MKQTQALPSLQSYAFQLRKRLVGGSPLEVLLTLHNEHQKFLAIYSPLIDPVKLALSDRFAWKFIREVNILNPKFMQSELDKQGHQPNSYGVYQDLKNIVSKIQQIWFPHMKDQPNVTWLKKFTTRKLAHYAKNRDEIAFSLVFDSADAPPEILNYLAYHELLHRQVGTKIVNGRRYHHTHEFKNQEQLFPNWQDIENQITKYIATTI